MGNKLSRKRLVVDERYTRPQGLYPNNDVDQKKLKKLILDSKLAPCYPGDDDCTFDLEECPICFLYYPSLNRSRCCAKGICTECFLQMKPPHATRATQCPFCKTCNYAVEYRGMRSKEEKGMEQVEEQRVIEAKIRMQQQEILDEEERTQRRVETSSSSRIMTPDEVGYRDLSSTSHAVPSYATPVESDEIVCSHETQSTTTSRQPSRFRQNRGDQLDVDLEDLMVMEAIWLSIQENGSQRLLTCGDDAAGAEPVTNEDNYASTSSSASPDTHTQSCPADPDEGDEIGSEVAEAGTSYASSDATVGNLSILPESFEEQMMLAMAVSLADARASRPTTPRGLAWL